MKYVYLIQSISHPNQRYVGLTTNLENRLTAHNHGQSPHTSKFRPWELVTFTAFVDEAKAAAFENISSPVPAGPLQKNAFGRGDGLGRGGGDSRFSEPTCCAI